MTKDRKVFVCPTCGRRIIETPHGLNQTIIHGLWRLHNAGGRSRLDKLNLTNSQFTNFQKTQYFGLAIRAKDAEGKINNEWILTNAGLEFLAGRRQMPKQVFVFNGKVSRVSTEKVYIDEITNCVQYKVEWQQNARQPSLFD